MASIVDDNLVEVAVLVPASGLFHYRVPPHLSDVAMVGTRVLVPFGARKINGIIVRRPAATAPVDAGKVRELLDVLGDVRRDGPVLSEELLGLAGWIADYYEAKLGDVIRAALPAGTEIAAADVLTLTDVGTAALNGDGDSSAMTTKRRDVLVYVASHRALTASKVPTRLRAELQAAITDGFIESGERRKNARAKAATERVARLVDGADVAALLAAAARAPKRRAVLVALSDGPLRVKALAETVPASAAALRELVASGAVVVDVVDAEVVARPASQLPAAVMPPQLTDEQHAATDAMVGKLGTGFASFLLFGITGSGKTEVYLHLIAEALKRGQGAIVLVPEISLTPQLAARFAARFGDQVAVLHSGLTERQRLVEWQRVSTGAARIAVGARSAVFAPVHKLGVIVVDEEHDGSFKQEEGVRYHARDVALVRAKRAGALAVLGSATPSLESYYGAHNGKHTLLTLTHRPTPKPLPEVQIIDLREHLPDQEAQLSEPLAAAITDALTAGDQVILFLNRRGFSTFVLCTACGTSFRCPHCSVSLTYHLHNDRLMCHYCGYSQRVPDVCPKCQAHGKIQRKGLGTERVAAGVAERFPGARVARLDRDVASGAQAEGVLAKVARREVDILVGTQMVTKGHDFPGVTLVGVLCADTGLTLPDFRASERTFQLLTQVAGRAGRGDRAGRVIVQTYRPEATSVLCAAAHDYRRFYDDELVNRNELGYPPVGRLVAVRIDGPDAKAVADAATRIADFVSQAEGSPVEVLGPVAAPLARLRGRTRWQLWLRSRDRGALRAIVRSMRVIEVPSAIRIAVDVDPISAL